MSKYDDLNLWLYQNKHHKKLEEELYIKQSPSIKPTPNNRSFLVARDRRQQKV